MKIHYLYILIFCLPLTQGFSQSDIPIGSWKAYLPYQQGPNVTQSSEKIIYATRWSILTIDKQDESSEFLSTVEGLTEVGIEKIQYDNARDQLIIAYDNSLIDIVVDDEVIPIFGIRDNSSFQNKKINHIYTDDGEFAYFATGFGIVQFDLVNYDFGFTSVSGFKVNSISRFDNYLLAATEDGLYYFDLNSNQIPNDFGNWELFEDFNGLPVFYNASDVNIIDESIYLVADDTIFVADDQFQFSPVYVNDESAFEIQFVEPIDEGWMLGLRSESTKSKILYFDENNVQFGEDASCSDRLNNAIQDEMGRIWFGEDFDDFRYIDGPMGGCRRLPFNSPKSHEASEVEIKDDVVYVASGGVSDAFGYLDSRLGFYTLKDGDWKNINEGNTPFLKDNTLLNHYTIKSHPIENTLYIGSFYRGLIEYNLDDESFILFDPDTSSLQAAIGDPDNTRVSGLAFDNEMNLWVANHGAAKPLSVYTAEGNWHSFNINAGNRLSQIAVDKNNFIWAVVGGNSGGVLVYDYNGTIADPSDDQSFQFTVNGSALSTALVKCLEIDLDGDVWVGTAEGPVIFECGGNAFDPSCTGSVRIVSQDSIGAILLQTENIRTIAIDGANRKWFGTQNGVFVQSPDGETQIFHFTKDNSPLFDDAINDLKYNPNTGEMFIVTEKGILSYRTASSGANEFRHDNNVFAYPNPVRADYNGPIAIKGLVRDANVKITDLNGQLVFETDALGGQAIWDGKDYTGKDVVSGVYLVFSSSTDNFNDPNSHVTKILVVR